MHKDQIDRYGGAHSIRDMGLVSSAVALPQAGFGGAFLHGSLFSMAAAYAYHVSENQPFLDGNKRTGLACALVFLELNGVRVDDPGSKLYEAMIKVGSRRMAKDGFAALLERLSPGSRR